MTIKVRTLSSLRDEMRGGGVTSAYEGAEVQKISAENLLRLLTAENRSLLQKIAFEHPGSIDALAAIAGRAPANVSRTLAKFVDLGLVRLVNGPGLAKRPELTVRNVTITLDICNQHDEITVE